MQTSPSQEAQTSPITTPTIDKTFSISLDSNNSISFDSQGNWSLHELIGAIVLSGVNLYVNNTTNPSMQTIFTQLQNINNKLG